VIEQTEALTVVDVNTGKYVGRSSLEETTAKINLEAVKEIVYQLRLRNIGGIIIIDFIDMKSEENRRRCTTPSWTPCAPTAARRRSARSRSWGWSR